MCSYIHGGHFGPLTLLEFPEQGFEHDHITVNTTIYCVICNTYTNPESAGSLFMSRQKHSAARK